MNKTSNQAELEIEKHFDIRHHLLIFDKYFRKKVMGGREHDNNSPISIYKDHNSPIKWDFAVDES